MCQKEGHWRRNCPNNNNKRKEKAESSNVEELSQELEQELAIVAEEANVAGQGNDWILDTGASCNMTYSESDFVELRELTRKVPDWCHSDRNNFYWPELCSL